MVEKFSHFKFMRLKLLCGVMPPFFFFLNHIIVSAIISIKSKPRAICCRVTVSADVIVGFIELSACLNVHFRILASNNQSRMSSSFWRTAVDLLF